MSSIIKKMSKILRDPNESLYNTSSSPSNSSTEEDITASNLPELKIQKFEETELKPPSYSKEDIIIKAIEQFRKELHSLTQLPPTKPITSIFTSKTKAESTMEQNLFEAVQRAVSIALRFQKINAHSINKKQSTHNNADDYSKKNVNYKGLDKLIFQLYDKKKSLENFAIKGIMVSMITIINLYLDDVYGNNISEDIFIEIYRRYLLFNNCCPFLEEDFPLAFNEFFKTFNIKFKLLELFSDIYWDSVFKYKDLCDVFLRNYKQQSTLDSVNNNNNNTKTPIKKETQDTMNKIIGVLWKCMSPLKKQISEKLKIYEYICSSNIELSEFIMKQKQLYVFDYSNINDMNIKQQLPSKQSTQLINVNNVCNSNSNNNVNNNIISINETNPNNINTTVLNSNITDNSTNISWEGGSEDIMEGDERELLTSFQTTIETLTETSRLKTTMNSLQDELDKKETNVDCINIETNTKKTIKESTSLFSTTSITNKINSIGFMGCIKGNSFYTERFNTDDYKNLNYKYESSLYKNNTPSSKAKQLVNSLLLDNNNINTNEQHPSCIYNISTSTSSSSNSIPSNQTTSITNNNKNNTHTNISSNDNTNNITPIELGYAKSLSKKSKVDFFQHIQTIEREKVKEEMKEDTRTNDEIINDINTVNDNTQRNTGKKKNKRKHKKKKQFVGVNNGDVNNNTNIINTSSSKSKSCFDNDVDLFKNALNSERVYAWQTQKINPSISPQWIELIS